MKKIVLAFFPLIVLTGAKAQAVFTYGKNSVSKQEFVTAFNKNPGNVAERKKALKEYLDLYINFKLKVQAAYDQKLQNDPTQKYELENFRKQVAENIINEEANVKDLVMEAFERSQKDIHLQQVFIEVPQKGDTLEAYKKISAAYEALKEGQEFDKVAREFSNDAYTQQTGGDLGFITVFTLPYEFENIAYSVKANSFSKPVRTKLGYHIFKNIAERKPLGAVKVAQILIAYPPGGSEAEKRIASQKADSVYALLQSGANFEELVTKVSNDLSTANNGGELTEFGIGTYNPVFEQAAFALKKKGDYSKPFSTNFGYHIIKLVESKPVATDIKDQAAYLALQEKVQKDDRLTQAKRGLLEKQLKTINYKPGVYVQSDLWEFTDSALRRPASIPVRKTNDNSILFTFAKQSIKASDWVKFNKAIRSSPNEFSNKQYPELLKDYLRITADEYYRNHLEDYNKEFKQQVKEFEEANLLFGIMDKNVWSRANVDSTGLLNYYSKHQQKYNWAPSADALIITCPNETIANEIKAKLETTPTTWRTVAEAFGSQVAADSGRYELGQLQVVDRTNYTNGLFTAPVKNVTDGSVTFNYLFKVYRTPDQRSFEDARGMIISDYQQVLEDNWIAELQKKYPVKVNQAVFNSIK